MLGDVTTEGKGTRKRAEGITFQNGRKWHACKTSEIGDAPGERTSVMD